MGDGIPASRPATRRSFPQLAATTPAEASRIRRLISTINVGYEYAHLEYTPSSEELIDIGEPCLDQVLNLMIDGDEETRLHASCVVAMVSAQMYGFEIGQGWPSKEAERLWKTKWRELGGLDWESGEAERRRSVELWRAWLRARAR